MRKLLFITVALFLGSFGMGYGQITWANTGSSTAWYTAANWSPSTASNAWVTSNIAQFANTGSATTAGINMATASLSIGAIEITSARTRVLTIGSSSSNGSLTLNGTAVNSVSNIIIRNNSNFLLTLQNNETGSGKTMNVALGNTSNNIINIEGTGGVTISSVISGTSDKNLTKVGSGTGVLTLSGVNTYSGNTTISAGTLALLGAGSIASSPNISVGSGGTFSVSGLTTALTLGASQTLRGTATGGNTTGTITVAISKNLTLSAGGLTFTAYGGGSTAPITVTGATAGALALNSAPVIITTTTALGVGTYTIVAKSGSATGVSGTAGTLTVNGSGLAGGATGALSVVSGELILTVTSSGSPSLSASALTAFGSQCINNTFGPNSFTITGSTLTAADVTVAALSGYTFSTTSAGTYTASLNLSQAGGAYSQEIFVKFTPTAATAYNGNIVVGGGGATSINVAASGTGVNTGISISTPTSTSISTTTATLGGNITNIGCSNATARGVEWSTSNGFADGTGTQVSASGSFGTGTFTQAVTGLPSGTIIYFKAYGTNIGGTTYSSQSSFTTLKAEPTNYPTTFACGTTTGSSIPLTWTAATGTVIPDGYLVKWSSTSYAAITAPTDGTAEVNGTTTQNVAGNSHTATGLSASTTYFFKIWSYTNSGSNINYKLVGEPQTSCATIVGPCFSMNGPSFATTTGFTAAGDIDSGGSPTSTIRLASGSSGGSISTTATGVTAGNVTVKFRAKAWDGNETSVTVTLDGNVQNVTTLPITFDEITLNFTSITANPTLTFSTVTNKRVHIGNVQLFCITPCTPPTTQATLFTSSAITPTTATVGWTRGNGNNVLVVARSGGAVNADPTNGTNYTANAAFGSGNQIGTGNYVVYKGAGTSLNLTALTLGTTYHFAVYEYLDTDICHNLTQLVGNFTTTVVDVTPPIVTTLSPTDGATGVAINSNLVLTFNENVVVGTAGNIVIYNSDNSVFETIPYNDGRIVFNGTTGVTINPTGTFANSAVYYVQISSTAIRDVALNNYTGISNTTDWNFTTIAPPAATVTDNVSAVAAANVSQGTSNHILSTFKVDVANSSTTLTEANIYFDGTYTAADIITNGLKLWYNSTNNFGTASTLQSKTAVSGGSGEIISFTGLSQNIAVGTGYFWVTSSVSITATVTRTIRVLSVVNTDLIFSTGTKSGSATISGVQTIIVPPAVTTATDYFRTSASGAWATAGNWESSPNNSSWITSTLAPTNVATAITILSPHNINIASGSVTADDLTVSSGGTLTISGGTFILNNGVSGTDLQVNGILTFSSGTLTTTGTGIAFAANSIYNHSNESGTLNLPIATWDVASTCNVTGMTNNGPVSGGVSIGQTFGNFNWNNVNQGNFYNIENSSFRVNGILTVGPTVNADNKLSFGDNSGTFNNTINEIVVSGGQLNGVGSNATVNLTITNSLSINGGFMAVSDGNGTANISVGTDLNLSGTGDLRILNKSNSPSQTLAITRDLIISDTAFIDMEVVGGTGVAIINVGRDFICTATANPTIDFGTGAVTGNVINITRNFSKSGSGQFQTTSATQATGFAFLGTGTFSYSGANSNFTSYIVQNGATIQMNSNLTLGTATNPPSWLTVANGGTLNFGTNSIIAGNTTDPRFIGSAGASLISTNTAGLGGTTATGSLQSFGSVGDTTAAGRAVFPGALNYTFNAITTTPFPNGTFGNPAIININAAITSNMTSNLTVTSAVNINNGGTFTLNTTNNNSLNLNNAVLTINTGGTFDNGGENQVINGGGTPTINVIGRFITRDVEGFVGSTSSIPAIVPVLSSGSTVEYGLAGNQAVQGSTAPTYQNVVFSNGGTKTLASINAVVGTITVADATILNVGINTFGGTGTNLTMTGTSQYITNGSGTKPDARGTYTLGANTTIEFANTSAGIIRLTPNYSKIIVSGTNVSNDSSVTGVKFQTGGTFTVKNGAIFKLNNTAGFSGSAATGIDTVTNSGPTITLEAGSTIDYAGTTQTVTNALNYKKLKVSEAGVKTILNDVRADEDVSVTAGELKIESDKNLIVTNSVSNTGGSITFENNASLVQTNGTTNTNSGEIRYKRMTRAMSNNYDFVYWASPVASTAMSTIWMAVNNNDTFYSWNNTSSSWTPRLSTATLVPGSSIIARSRNGQSGTNIESANQTYTLTSPWTGLFKGVPNNGDIAVTIGNSGAILASKGDNLIGNPYPCSVDLEAFYDDNTTKLTGVFQLWRATTAITNNEYASSDYVIYTAATGVTIGAPTSARYLAASQGFIATALATNNATETVMFRNSQKVVANNNSFNRTNGQNTNNRVENHNIWLNLKNNQGIDKQMVVQYAQSASLGFDERLDVKTLDGNQHVDFYSIATNNYYTLQSRPLPFTNIDIVPLGFKTSVAGAYKISIDRKNGLFINQTVYIEDMLNNTLHNLTLSPYDFTSSTGVYNNRFKLRFNNTVLSNPTFEKSENVYVYKNNQTIGIKSDSEPINNISVFDVLGRIIYEKRNINNELFEIQNINVSNATLLIKITLKNGKSVVKKMVH